MAETNNLWNDCKTNVVHELFKLPTMCGSEHKISNILNKHHDIIQHGLSRERTLIGENKDFKDNKKSVENLAIVKLYSEDKDFLYCMNLCDVNRIEHSPVCISNFQDNIHVAKLFSCLYIGCNNEYEDYETSNIMSELMRDPEIMFKITQLALTFDPTLKLFYGLNIMIIHSENLNEHLSTLDETFNSLREAQLKIIPKKSMLLVSEIDIYGFELSSKGISIPNQVILYFEGHDTPKSIMEVKQLLATLKKYKSFISQFAIWIEPIQKSIQKPQKLRWTEACCRALRIIVLHLHDIKTLHFPTIRYKLYVDCDSNTIIGNLKSSSCQPIAYYSEALSKEESKYCEKQKHVVAVAKSLMYFQSFYHSNGQLIVITKYQLCDWFDEKQIENLMKYRKVIENIIEEFNISTTTYVPCGCLESGICTKVF